MRNELKSFLAFGVVGTLGFIIDTGLLYLVMSWTGLYYGRFISFSCSVVCTWLLNKYFTFRKQRSGHTTHKEFAIYAGLMIGGGVVNYAVYAAFIMLSPLALRHPIIAVAAGSLAGMLVNFSTARFLLFNKE